MSKYREHGLFNAAHQEILLIYDSSKTTDERNELVAVIPFIYAKQRERSDSEKQVYTKENARLIIMLKDELDKYFIAYLRDGKHYELWLEEQKSHELYTKPDHHFNHEIDNLMDELSNVDENGNPSIDIDRIKWHLSGLSRNKEIRRFLIEDVAAHDLTTIDVGRALKTYCTYI